MDICDPWILRAERFGSREIFGLKKSICGFCGERILDEFVCDIAGNLFCSPKCRERFNVKRKEAGK